MNLISCKTMSRVTLHELLEEVGVSPTQLDKACTSEDLRDIALFLDSWRTVALYLKLSKVQVQQVERDGTDENEKRLKFFEYWKGKFAFKAKYLVLVKELTRLNKSAVFWYSSLKKRQTFFLMHMLSNKFCDSFAIG